MKQIILKIALAATLCAGADAVVRTVESTDGKEPADYVPAMLSNGRINIFVDYGLSIAKHTKQLAKKRIEPGIYWEGRRAGDNNGSTSRFGYFLMPQGEFRTRIVVDGKEQCMPKNWKQSLDLHNALTTTTGEYDGGIMLNGEAFVAKTCNTIALRQEVSNKSREPRKVTFGIAYGAPRHPRIVGGKWECVPGTATWSMKCFGRFVTEQTIVVNSESGIRNSELGAPETKVVGGSAMLQHTVTLAPGEKRAAEWFVTFEDNLEKMLPAVTKWNNSPTDLQQSGKRLLLNQYAQLRASHTADWQAYFAQSEINVPDERIREMFEMARYHMRCVATEWSIPVGVIQSHWQGKIFAFDEMYGAQGLLAAGHFDTAKVAADFRAATLKVAAIRCNKNQQNPFYGCGARWVWEAAEGNDVECSPLGFWMDHIFQQAAIAQTMWTYYRYTGDRDYLVKKGYDVIRECALFFRKLQVLDLPDGTSFVTKCTDLERMGAGHERAFMTTCGVITTLRAAADAADVVGKDAELAADFRACATRLVASLPERDGRYIARPDSNEESMGTLAGFYPFHTFDRTNTKQMAAVEYFLKNGQAFGNMYDTGKRICPWYAATMAMAALRAGNEEYPAIRWLQEAVRSGGCWGEFWEINEPGVSEYRPWFMTAAGNVLYAICQLFVAEMEGGVHLAAGVPHSWKDYSFRLPASGGYALDVDVKNGTVAKFNATARNSSAKKPAFLFKGRELKDKDFAGNIPNGNVIGH